MKTKVTIDGLPGVFSNGSVCQEKLHELRLDEEFQTLCKWRELFREIPIEVIAKKEG